MMIGGLFAADFVESFRSGFSDMSGTVTGMAGCNTLARAERGKSMIYTVRKNTFIEIGTSEMKVEEIENIAVEFRRLKTDFAMMAGLVEELDDFLRMLEDHRIRGWDSQISEMRSHTARAMREILAANK